MAQQSQPINAVGYAARDTSGVLSPFHFTRRAVGARDVEFKVLYCGICHSDLNGIRNDWGNTHYPIVAGHEIVGEVTRVGSEALKFKPGDKVGAGYIINSCGECEQCGGDLQNYCPKAVVTYNSVDKDGTITRGGYSDVLVADENYLVRWPDNFPMEAAPLLCAGITTYSPLKYFGLDKPGQHIGVVGLGGLGHVAVKFAKAFGAKVTVISTSINKKQEALQNLKADGFLVSRDQAEMQSAASTFDGILDTVSAPHPIQPLVTLLKPHGKLVLLGVVPKPFELTSPGLILGRKIVGGSSVGGIKETQEMIDFAAEKNVLPEVEVVGMDYLNEAMERLHKGDVKYRFVVDVGNTFKTPPPPPTAV